MSSYKLLGDVTMAQYFHALNVHSDLFAQDEFIQPACTATDVLSQQVSCFYQTKITPMRQTAVHQYVP